MVKIGCGCLVLSGRYIGNVYTQNPASKSILLLRRGPTAPTFPGAWGGPGGLFEDGKDKSWAGAASREALEECNIVFAPENPPFIESTWEGDNRLLKYFLGYWFIEYGGLRFNDNEADDYGFFTAEEALKMELSFRYREAILKLQADGML